MTIKTAEFIKSALENDPIFQDGREQVAFIGRSNVGKSSLINALTSQKGLAKTSSFPGRTQQINLFLINNSFYLVDLPGYGYAKLPKTVRQNIENLVNWYFFVSGIKQKKVILIIDAKVGPTKDDLEILEALEAHGKDILIAANKVDKIKKADYAKQIVKIKDIIGYHQIVYCSAEKKIGVIEILKNLE